MKKITLIILFLAVILCHRTFAQTKMIHAQLGLVVAVSNTTPYTFSINVGSMDAAGGVHFGATEDLITDQVQDPQHPDLALIIHDRFFANQFDPTRKVFVAYIRSDGKTVIISSPTQEEVEKKFSNQ